MGFKVQAFCCLGFRVEGERCKLKGIWFMVRGRGRVSVLSLG